MRSRTLSRLVVCAACALPTAALASVSLNQTFKNNTGQAAGGFNWWFTPDCTTSNLGSNVFTLAATSHINPGTHGYTTEIKVHYSGGNVNNGASANNWATLSNTSAIAFRTEWTNTNGVPIGSANIPLSLGGVYYTNLNGNIVWRTHIDNPNATGVTLINNFKYGISQVELSGPALQGFSNWNSLPGTIALPPGAAFEYDVMVPDDSYFPLVSAELNSDLEPSDVSTLIFQVTPEPAALSAIAILLAGLLPRRVRS